MNAYQRTSFGPMDWRALLFCGTVFFLALSGIASAQSTAQFEVASIRELVGGVRTMAGFKSSGPRVEYEGFSILMLVSEAWNVRADQIVLSDGVPSRVVYPTMEAGRSAGMYQIVALANEGTAPTRDEFRPLLKSLLETRFKLKTHIEKRDKDVYVLETNGMPKLKASDGDGTCHVSASRTSGGQKIVATHCTLQVLIGNLFVDRPVYDQTGLTGFYDFESTAAFPSQINDPDSISPFTAVKAFGLKLEAKRLSVDTIVIDHVEAPEQN
jgi:uncharacterized protein (TIGR03435 family)